ncbi:TetR/AcrR family transcriptional regulator [Corynebacterium callunae]|uniref:TetR/AcrR family transcriptional regulator n=1 Tax=Corynebacterium callunae TaxID=1721 RepID=UPI003981CAFF
MRTDARARRQKIIATACELYRSQHHDSVTMENIAEKAGVGIATVYRNFPDRFSLDMACAHFLFEGVIALEEAAIANFDQEPGATWTSFNRALIDKGLGSLVPALVPRSLDELPPEVSQLRQKTEELTETLINHGKKHGLVHPDIDERTYIVGLITISRTPMPALAAAAGDLSTTLLGIFLSGIKHGSQPV